MKLKKQEKAADTSLWKIMQQSPHKSNILAWFLAQHYNFFFNAAITPLKSVSKKYAAFTPLKSFDLSSLCVLFHINNGRWVDMNGTLLGWWRG